MKQPDPARLDSWMTEMERRVANIERRGSFAQPNDDTRRVSGFAGRVDNGADPDTLYQYRVLDDTGAYVMAMGDIDLADATTEIGFSLYGEGGATVLASGNQDNGLIWPFDHAGWMSPAPTTVTSGTFQTIAEIEIVGPPTDGVYFSAALTVDAATTAEVRIYDLTAGVVRGNTLSIAGAAAKNVICEWLHPYSRGWGDDEVSRPGGAVLQYQVRRSAGAANVNAYFPRSFVFRNSRFMSNVSSTTPLVAV